ncbi:MAG: metal ABC transporter permease [Planctomycetia bacterium]|nr:metal ABC transporter permease [Planctomycetia bacterium]
MSQPAGIPYNTLVVAAAVAAVGFAAGVIGSFGVLRRRALVSDAAAHATLAGVVAAFLATGRRDLPTLLAGAFAAAVLALGGLVVIRRFTRTRDDAATAIVLGVSFGLGIALLAGISARGIPGAGGLEHFLLGHTAALTAGDATALAAAAALAVLIVWLGLKEATLVAFDPAFAAATGWPVALIDYALVTLMAAMVVVGLPAAGAVLVTALVVIPPVTARLWTERVATMVPLAGAIGLVAAVGGVATSNAVPRLPTGPTIVLVAAGVFSLSFFVAPRRGWFARRRAAVDAARALAERLRAAAAGEQTAPDPRGA